MTLTVWVTGVDGLTGRYLAEYLRAQEPSCRIVGLDCASECSVALDAFYSVDICESKAITELALVEPPTHVIHLAAVMPPASESQMWYVNAGGTLNLIKGLNAANCSGMKLLSVGSAAEYFGSASCPIDENSPSGGEAPYGQSKWAQTTIALALGQQFGIEVMIARPFNFVGPGMPEQTVAASLSIQFANSEPNIIKVGNTQSVRDFTDIRDVVSAYWAIVTQGEAGEIYNVCTGQGTQIEAVINLFSELTGDIHRVEIDGDRLKQIDPSRSIGNASKLHDLTGWAPEITLRQSLEDMLEGARK